MYEPELVQKVKDLAVIGLCPAQIAERLGLVGEPRRKFLADIVDGGHPLGKEYYKSRKHYQEDIDAALSSSAMTGDPKALRLNYELLRQNRIDMLKKELFGI